MVGVCVCRCGMAGYGWCVCVGVKWLAGWCVCVCGCGMSMPKMPLWIVLTTKALLKSKLAASFKLQNARMQLQERSPCNECDLTNTFTHTQIIQKLKHQRGLWCEQLISWAAMQTCK